MADQNDVDLAKRLIKANILDSDALRPAFDLQQRVLEEKDQHVTLARVIEHLGLLPKGTLAPAMAPSPLETQPFEGYRLDRVIGEGGTSMVYGGVYLENDAAVAIKVLDPVSALRPMWLERFREEARILSSVEHDNVIFGYEIGEGAGLHFFSMEAIDGLTAHEIIERRGTLTNQEALSITLQTARALGALHAAGYLHRDVKPSNVMVEATGRAVMIDLGFTRALHDGSEEVDEDAPSESTTVGTVEYVSPEQARGRADLDPRSDIYSLGVSLYHMIVGDVPFKGESAFETMAKQVLSSIDQTKVKQRRIAPEVQFFITKMMSKDRALRFESMAHVVEVLAGYVERDPTPVDLGAPVVAQPIASSTEEEAPQGGDASGPAPSQEASPKKIAPARPPPDRGAGKAPVRRRRTRGDKPPPRRRRR